MRRTPKNITNCGAIALAAYNVRAGPSVPISFSDFHADSYAGSQENQSNDLHALDLHEVDDDTESAPLARSPFY